MLLVSYKSILKASHVIIVLYRMINLAGRNRIDETLVRFKWYPVVPKETIHEDIELNLEDWDGSGNNPANWKRWRKALHMVIPSERRFLW